MGLKNKVVISVNAAIILVCICMGIVGYNNANSGFDKALEMKAESDVKSLAEIIDYRYIGNWNLRDGTLYKGDVKIDGNEEVVDSLAKVTNGKVTIFSGDTRVATNVKDAGGKRQVGTKASQTIIDAVLKGGKDFLGTADILGEPHHAAYQPIKDNSGKVIGMLFVGVSVHEMDDVVNSLITSIIIVMAIIIVAGVIASSVFVGKLLGALEEVVQATGKIADGDLGIDDLKIRSSDEIGTLAKEINIMKQKLKNLLTNIAQSSEKVAAAAEELTAATQEGRESINNMAQSAAAMSEESNSQMDNINALQAQLHNMREKMAELYQGAMDLDLVAANSAESTVIGQEKIGVAIDVMNNIAAQVHASVEVVENLGKRSDEIGEIVKTISAIADQTNLLALNAAIEAARAGEHGRGFAVVADEVRKLAEQSSVSAESITQLITSIQGETAAAVETISRGTAGVNEGVESVKSTGDAFKNIGEQVEKLTGNVVQSMINIEEVNSGNDEIVNAVNRTQEITQKSNETATSISAVAEEQTAMISEISESSKTLADLAAEMQNEVAKFRL
ncbi:MAG: cache domain-containing protein [Selenomonadaceae bacterium]|nr:cache domain-containing protein [Selenomonadaceae bacterium]